MSDTSPPSLRLNAASLKHVLYSEIISVTSVMRKNSRWAASPHYATSSDAALGTELGLRKLAHPQNLGAPGILNRELDLMSGFQELKSVLKEVDDVSTIELPTVFAPFFALIRSPLSTGPITSAALSALHKFFICGLITPTSPSLDNALIELSSTVSHCKFEASDSSGDEVVLFKIMTVISDCLCGSVGSELGDIEVCEMLETVLTTCCQRRLSEILRQAAETTMQSLVRTVFERLHSLDPTEEEAKLHADDDSQESEIKMTVSTNTPRLTEDISERDGQVETNPREPPSQIPPLLADRPKYGLPSVLELLRVIINVLDPNDQQHTDSTRLIALEILNAAFEAAGPRIAQYPSLESLVIDPGCKYLFQLARSENPSVLHASLRTITTIFDTMRKHLKLQQELFLAFTMDRLALSAGRDDKAGHGAVQLVKKASETGRPASPAKPLAEDEKQSAQDGPSPAARVLVAPARGQTRDLILETLTQIARHSSFMVDLYVNYDCDINCENIFERLVDFLTKAVYPSAYHGLAEAQQRNAQYLSLDLLLAFVNDMAARANGSQEPWPSEFPSPESLIQTKSRKQLVLTGAARFNAKPKTGLSFLEENGLIYADLSPEVSKELSLARFLKGSTRLDKRLLGDFISRPDNQEVLKEFIGLFEFEGKSMADAMRELLETFRLPGESQQIARITEVFASKYFASGPPEIKSEDAVYVLAYSIIMLNTDLHNPQVRSRMALDDYRRNLRQVNDGTDFSPEFLQNIYESIRKRELIMPEEHTGQLGFEYAWKELLARSRQTGHLTMCNTDVFDIEIFKLVWKPVISAISHAFISFEDDYIIQRAIAGFRQCATLAGRFNLPDVFDFVVVSLSQATSLLSGSPSSHVPNYPVVDVEGQSVTVSNLSVKFGTNFKGQLAAVVLFNIVNGNGNALREGWVQIFDMFQNLFLHSLLPTRMLQMEDFLAGVSMIPLRSRQPPRPANRTDGGLLSALSSYLMTPYSASSETMMPTATHSEVENTLCTVDCITSCRLDELYSQIMQLDLEPMVAAVRALEALAHERTVAKLRQESDDNGQPDENGQPAYSLPYDPASIFLLETMTSISCQSPQYIEELWPIAFEHLSALLSSSTQYSILLIERAVVSLLRLCLLLAKKPALRDQIYLSFDLLAGLPPSISNAVAEQVVAGVVMIVQKHREIINSQTEWSLVFALIRCTIAHPEAGRLSFDLVSALASEGPNQLVTVDNFPGLVSLLDEFATNASLLAETQQAKGNQADPLTAANSPAIDRGKKAVDLLANLTRSLPSLATSASTKQGQAWRQLCLPLLSSLGRQSANAARDVRHSAISQLQRILLGPSIVLDSADHSHIEDIFNRVIFPLLDDLLKPQVFKRDPLGMPETRLRGSALLCKVFMHLELRESEAKTDFRILWIQILDLLDRLMNVEKGGQLSEAVPESLKNVILVMCAAGVLVPPPQGDAEDVRDERQTTLWTATEERLKRFLPGFLADVVS